MTEKYFEHLEGFVGQARQALEGFHLEELYADPLYLHPLYVRATAGTGSVYEMYRSVYTAGSSRDWPLHLISVTSPWRNCYPLTDHGLLHPAYFLEKLGRPGREPSPMEHNYHGGDVFALLRCAQLLLPGREVPDPAGLRFS